MNNSESPAEVAIRVELPAYDWCMEAFNTKSAAARYLYRSYESVTIKDIAAHLHMPYRQVYGVIRRMRKELESAHERVCPVCRRLI